jgi:hypothetical protein
LTFNDITGLPVNTTLSAFNDGFIEAKVEIIRQGRKCFIAVTAYYNLSRTGTETADEYANDIANEFLKVFGYNLNSIHQHHEINSSTNTIKVVQQFGYLDYSMYGISPFLKYRPTDGFGKLIDNFLPLYVPGSDVIGLIDLYYNVIALKNESTFSWGFTIGGYTSRIFSGESTETINLNELIGNSMPIVASTPESEINIEIEKTQSMRIDGSIVTYTLNVSNITPDGYTIAHKSSIEQIKYKDLTNSLDNVIVTVGISEVKSPNIDWTLIGVVVCVCIAILATVLYFRKKSKNSRRKMYR